MTTAVALTGYLCAAASLPGQALPANGDDGLNRLDASPRHGEWVRYDAEVYHGAGHGFLRAQAGRDGANVEATRKAWPRTVMFMKDVLQ